MNKLKQPVRVNEQIIRGVAFQVCALALLSIAAGFLHRISIVSAGIILFLLIDFIIRAFADSRFSLLALCSKKLNNSFFRFQKAMIALRPKKFAAGIGAAISAAAFTAWYFNLIPLMQILMAMLALFSFLEGVFRFCAGCKIFSLLIRAGIFKEDLCTDCILPGGEGI